MTYAYVSYTQDGKSRRGTSDLTSREAVIRDLEREGLVVVSVEEVTTTRTARRARAFLFGRISNVEKVLFTKHLTVMLRAGLTLIESLQILEEQAGSWSLKRIVRRLRRRIEAGDKFSGVLDEFPRVFSAFYVNIVRAGEVSGTLEGNLEHLAAQLAKEYELRKKVQSAMMYPIVVLIAAAFIGFFFATYVLPQVANLFTGLQGIELPLVTRVLLSVAGFTRRYTLAAFFGLLGVIVFFLWFLRRRFLRPATHWMASRAPIFGKIVKDINLARFALVFGTLLRSGIDITKAIEVTSTVLDNIYYKRALARALVEVQRGIPISESLARHPDIFPKLVIRMIGVGERSGKLEEVLGYLSDFYELEVETTMKNLSTILEPVLLLFIGLVTLAVAYAILIPIYNFIAAIRRI